MAAAQPGRALIGISGWTYAPWRGVFYPKGVRQSDELAYASSRLNSIEINGSFYSLQRPTSWERWREATPERFVFAVKGPRYITHLLRLRNSGAALANFFASGILGLGPKLGPLLWQLPPRFAFDPSSFDEFCALLPTTTGAALQLARSHEERMTGRVLLRIEERTVRSGTRSRCAIRAGTTRGCSRSSGGTGSPACSPTPQADTRSWTRIPQSSAMCACTAIRNST